MARAKERVSSGVTPLALPCLPLILTIGAYWALCFIEMSDEDEVAMVGNQSLGKTKTLVGAYRLICAGSSGHEMINFHRNYQQDHRVVRSGGSKQLQASRRVVRRRGGRKCLRITSFAAAAGAGAPQTTMSARRDGRL